MPGLRGWRRMSARKIILILTILLILIFYKYDNNSENKRPKLRTELTPHEFCTITNETASLDDLSYWGYKSGVIQPRILVVASSSIRSFRNLTELLLSIRLRFRVVSNRKKLPELVNHAKDAPKYLLIIFQNIEDYYHMDGSNRRNLDNFCRTFHVGIVGFVSRNIGKVEQPMEDHSETTNKSSAFTTSSLNFVSNIHFHSHPLLRILKHDSDFKVSDRQSDWTAIEDDSNALVSIASAEFLKTKNKKRDVVMEDKGASDGIAKILIGGVLDLWFIKVLLLDAIDYLTHGAISLPLTRYILVDIDDIFVGEARMVKSDVLALADSQKQINKLCPGFKYNLGFSGYYYKHGSDFENAGDETLIDIKEQFWWWPHMWKHIQPHRYDNVSTLMERMKLNKKFAESHSLPVQNRYAVAPHHSGVYPVHEQLYQSWTQVWNISTTSTEEYPKLYPSYKRRGFKHAGIHVLPRQTCGLFTKNLYFEDYPGGPDRLENSIKGGDLFWTVLANPISIFMTHMPNYCCDRLAPYTFQSLFSFVRCNTNINLITQPPSQLAATYFKLFPEEEEAIWTNPCDDRRHLEIWSETKKCDRFPNVVVIGPQKTGSTALYSFLQMHPSVYSNHPSKTTFEEVQFFSGPNYKNGIDWYLDFFPPRNESTNRTVTIFEKSATYFDGDQVPVRVSKLLPKSRIVCILTSPGERAYSWYQHMRAHNDPTALTYTFYQVLESNSSSPKPVRSLKSRCLEPGKYVVHLERWLAEFPSSRFFIVDGDELKNNPVDVMNSIQSSLRISPVIDYGELLFYDESKGFYCMKIEGRKKCLGKGKGRHYPPMEEESKVWLSEYFKKYNQNLEKLFIKIGQPSPKWLSQELSESD